MSELDDKLGAILNNPQMMQKISEMAQAMNASAPPPQNPPVQETSAPEMPMLDPKLLGSLAGMMKSSGMNDNERTLLRALGPYLSQRRIRKLEQAMRAAKMAGLASSFLGAGGLQMLTGR